MPKATNLVSFVRCLERQGFASRLSGVILLRTMRTYQFTMYKVQLFCILFFICPFQMRLTFRSFGAYRILTFISMLIIGIIFGAPQFSPQAKLIDSYPWSQNGPSSLSKSSSLNKSKFFFYLVFKDWLSTRNLLRCTNKLLQGYSCVKCISSSKETLLYLLVDIPFALACWNTVHLFIPAHTNFLQVIVSLKDQIRLPFFMEIVITMCWSIWTIRNHVIFRNIPASIQCKSMHLQTRVFSRYPKTKRKILTSNRFMARSFCVIFHIFFVSFLVS